MRNIDYTKMGPDGSVTPEGSEDKRWWLAPKSELAQAISKIVKFMAEYDQKRQTQYQMSARLYGNVSLMGINGMSFSKIATSTQSNKDRVAYNVCQSVVDTITAKIAKNKPKPLFLTSGGDYKIQRRAQKLDKFVEGVFYENLAYRMGPDAFKDGTILGDGIIHVFDLHDRVKWERVIPSELYVDYVEGFYGHPRQMHRVKNVDRDVLCDLFPSKKKSIMEANSASADIMGSVQNVADQVTVVESWHLPSGPEAKDGLHTIIIEDEVLFTEPWDKPFFPFAVLNWSKRLWGFWGQGLVEQIQNIQLEINKILWIIQRSFHLAGSFKVFLQNGSKVVKEHLNNDIGAIVNYTGAPPQYIVPPIVPMEMYSHLQNLKNSAYEQSGISQLSASAQKPAGLNSGKALREYNDIETERFMVIGQAYEDFFMDLARLSVSVAKDIYARNKSYEVKVPGKKFIDTIDWADIDLEEDEYVMKIFPVSSLPSDPAGRLQTIQEYAQAGLINPRQAKKLLDFPDLEAVEGLANAEDDYLHEILDAIIEDAKYTPPEPYDDLKLARELALEYYAQGKCSGLEEEKLELLRTFMDQITILEQKAMPPMPQQPMAGPGATPNGMGAPQANPAAPPQSDLIANVPGVNSVQ